MAGVKGAGGPPPKRSSQRRRDAEPVGGTAEQASTPADVQVPPAGEWYPSMVAWYESLARSGQAQFYTAGDWHTAWVIADAMSRELNPQPIIVGRGDNATVEMHSMPVKAATLAAFLKACASLLATEGDRRRARLELERKPMPEGGGDVSWIDDARSRLRGGTG